MIISYIEPVTSRRVRSTPQTDTSHTITGLTPNTEYTLTLTSVDTSGNEAPAPPHTVRTRARVITVPITIPNAIQNFMVTPVARDCTKMDLRWIRPSEPNVKEVRITWANPDGESQPVVITDLATTNRQITGLKSNTEYDFSIFSRNTTNEDSEITTQSARTSSCDPLQAPTRRASSVTTTSITLNWTNPPQRDFTHVILAAVPPTTDSDGNPIAVSTHSGEPGDRASHTISNLSVDTEYSFRLTAVDTSNDTAFTTLSLRTSPDTTTPPTPISNFGVRAVSADCTKMALTWDAPTDLDLRELRISWSPADGESQPVTVTSDFNTATSKTITGLKSNTPYTFQIIAEDNDGNTSSEVTGTATSTSTCDPLQAPTRRASSVTTTSITLNWTNPPQKDFTHVTVSAVSPTTDSYGNAIASTDHEGEPGATASHTIRNLSVDTEYSFRLTAVDTSDDTAFTTLSLRTSPDTTTPPSPIANFGVTAAPTDCTKMALTWDAPTELDLRELRISWLPADGESQPVRVTSDFATTTSKTITRLKSNTPYTFQIIAEDNDGNTSSEVTGTATRTSTCAALEAPTMRASSVTTTSITLNWTNPSQKDFTHVTLAAVSPTTDSYGNAIAVSTHSGEPGSRASHTIRNLSVNTEYSFRLTAVDTSNDTAAATLSVSTSPDRTTPPSPIANFGVTAVPTDCTKMALTWDAPTDLDLKELRISWLPADGESQPARVTSDFSTATSKTITRLRSNTSYTFKIIAEDNDGNASSEVTGTVTSTSTCDPLEAPTSGASSVTTTSITLNWTNPPQKDFTHVTITAVSPTTDSDGATIATSIHNGEPGATDSHTISNLSVNTEYSFRLTAVDRSNDTAATTLSVSTSPDSTTPPSPISNFGVTAVSTDCTKMALTWDAPTDLDLKELRINWSPTDGESQPVRVTSDFATATSKTITGLKSNTPYTFKIIAEDNDGNDSSEVTGIATRTSACAALEAPTIGASSATTTSITLNWTNPSQKDFTHVTLAPVSPTIDKNGNPIAVSTHRGEPGATDSHTITSLNADTEYTFRLTAVDTSNDAEATDSSVRTSPDSTTSPSPISNFRVTAVPTDCTKMALAWDAPTDLDLKELRINWSPTDGESQPVRVTSGFSTATSKTITRLKSNTSYTFKIIAEDNDGNTSSEVTGAITNTSDCGRLQAPTIGVSSATATSITLNWTNPSQKNFKHVTVAAVTPTVHSDGTTPIATTTHSGESGATDSHTITNLNADTAYTFRLTAVNTSDDPAATNSSVRTLPDADGDGWADNIDVDDDNDGLIEIHNLDMLRHIHNNQAGTSYDDEYSDAAIVLSPNNFDACGEDTENGGGTFCGAPTTRPSTCPSGSPDVDPHVTNEAYLCGYELVGDLDFADASSYATGSGNKAAWCTTADCNASTGTGFPGVGPTRGNINGFAAIFEGNGFTISHLYMRNTSSTGNNIGLFRLTTSDAQIRNLGLVGANVYGGGGRDHVGILVGQSRGSSIRSSYVKGSVHGGGARDYVGGLAGSNFLDTAVIIASYALVEANGDAGDDYVGGLVGCTSADSVTSSVKIVASYAVVEIDGGADDDWVGGLVGFGLLSVRIVASYVTGVVDGGAGTGDTVGGLAGIFPPARIHKSYSFVTKEGGDGGTDGTALPTGVSEVGDLTDDSTDATTYVGAEWNRASDNTQNAWKFGSSRGPRLRIRYLWR